MNLNALEVNYHAMLVQAPTPSALLGQHPLVTFLLLNPGNTVGLIRF